MKLVRAVFLHSDRVADLVLTLKFDKFLTPKPDNTVIFVGPWDLDFDLLSLLESYQIDVKNFKVVKDREMWNCDQPPVDIYRFKGWISQQFLKLLALDFLDYDCLLIQDCDTFCIKNYTWLSNQQPQLLTRSNSTHSAEYYQYLEKFTGIPRRTEKSFVTEFMPVLKSHWHALKTSMHEHFGKAWYQVLYDQFLEDFATQHSQIWFSEYELLGNWALWQNPNLVLIEQTRFDLVEGFEKNLHGLASYNCVCGYGLIDLPKINDLEREIWDNMPS